jgi:predicted negative regulator of RcsB-dependent stress response
MVQRPVSHKAIRDRLKKDDLQDWLNRVMTYGKANLENLIISGIIVLLIFILTPLYFKHQATNEMRANNLLQRAFGLMQQPTYSANREGWGGFKNAAEKYQKCAEAFAEVGNTYGNTRYARLARLGEANCYFELKSYDKARMIFEEQLATNNKDTFAPVIQEHLGQCYEQLNQWDKAESMYRQLLATWPNYFHRTAVQFAQANCLIKLGKNEEANKLLLTASHGDTPSSLWQELVRQQLASNAVYPH